MQYRMINKISVSLVPVLLATLAVTAVAENSGNPWALPQVPEKVPNFQRAPQYGQQRYQDDQTNIQYPGYRFVTPEILDSLKKQQMQTQQIQGDYPYRQHRRQSVPPAQGYYGLPPASMGFADPLYDTPAVSPWGSDPDVIYRGESFPWVPDAAIGGIPPINVSPFIGNDEQDTVESGSQQKPTNVFNPFTFAPNGNL